MTTKSILSTTTVDESAIPDPSLTVAPQPNQVALSAWAPLRHRLFLGFWIVGFISNVGTWTHELAAAYYMAEMRPSPLWVSMVRTAMSLPVFCLAFIAGAIADRVDRRKLLMATQIVLCFITAAMAGLTFLQWMTPTLLLVATFCIGLGTCFHVPTWQAIVPEIVSKREIPAAVGLGSMSFNLARCIGPAFCGLVIGYLGVSAAFAINALSFVGVIVLLLMWNQEVPNRSAQGPKPPLSKTLVEGFSYLWNESRIRNVYIRVVAYIVPASIVWALMPLVSKEKYHLESRGFGFLISSFGLGAVIGIFFLPAMRNRWGSNKVLLVLTAIFAIGVALIAMTTHVAAAVIAMSIIGCSWMGILTTLNATLQIQLKSDFRARGMSMYLSVLSASIALGALLWGNIAAWLGSSESFLVAAVMAFLLYLATLRARIANLSELE